MKRLKSKNMKKNHIMLIAIGCVFMLCMWACSNDDEQPQTFDRATRQTTTEDEDTEEEEDFSDVTGASPVVSFYSVDEEDTVKVTPGESQTAQAPLVLNLKARIGNPDGYKYICEWRIWSTKDSGTELNPLVTRFEENTSYTLTKSGGYGIKLYVTFTQGTDTIEYESDPINVVISESKLTCPDAFSPNNDSINDCFRITAQSIVELDARFFDRWGIEMHKATLETAKHVEGEPNKLVLWDGKYNGKVVSDGIYFLHLDALGSDGIKYRIKKSICVMTGYREGEETGGSGGGGTE